MSFQQEAMQSKNSILLWASVIFVGSLLLYSVTLSPDLLWGGGDFASFQTAAYLGDIWVGKGVFAHPLWVILAHPFTKLAR